MDWFLVCIAARLALAYAATRPAMKHYVLSFLLIVSVTWYSMTIGIIKRDTGREAGGRIWWKHLRLLHATNYLLAALYLYKDQRVEAASILVADVAIGSFLRFRHRRYI